MGCYTHSFNVDGCCFTVRLLAGITPPHTDSLSVPSVVVVSINVQDLLALDTQNARCPVSIGTLQLALRKVHTQRARIPSDLEDVSCNRAPPCGVVHTCAEHDDIVFRGDFIHIRWVVDV